MEVMTVLITAILLISLLVLSLSVIVFRHAWELSKDISEIALKTIERIDDENKNENLNSPNEFDPPKFY